MKRPTTTEPVLGVKVGRIARPDLHAEVTSRLAKLIAASEPSARIATERELSEQLGVGRSTVREAIRSLAFIGALDVRHGDGIYVSQADNDDVTKLVGLGLLVRRSKVHEIIEVRHLLEVEAVSKAAERHDEVNRLMLLEIMEQMVAYADDPDEAARLDLEFHAALSHVSHNSVLTYLIDGMRGLFELWLSTSISDQEVVEKVIKEHRAILDAVLARDSKTATHLMSQHLEHAAQGLLARVTSERLTTEYMSSFLAPKG